MAGTITTTTDAQALEYPGQSFMDYKVKYTPGSVFMATLTGTTLDLWRQPSGTGAWVHQTGMALARTGIVELCGMFVDTFAYAHIVYRVNESSKDRIMYRRINIETDPNVYGSELVVCEASNGGVAGSVYMGADVVAVANGAECRVAIAVAFLSGSTTGVEMYAFKVSTGSAFPSSTTNVTTTSYGGTRRWTWTGSGYMAPSLDLQHNGNAHTSSAPHLWLTVGRTRQMFAKLTWGSGKWTGPSSLSTFNASGTVVASNYSNGRWDGSRYISSTVLSASPDAVTINERDSANSKTTVRTTPAHPQGNIRARAINYDFNTKDMRVWAVGTTTAQLYFVDYDRASAVWGTWSQFSVTALQDVLSYGMRRGSAGGARFDVYWQPASASPYSLVHVEQALTFAPSTPVMLTPAPGQAADVGDPLFLTWSFVDLDPGSSQSAYAVSRQIGAGAVQYWNASTSAWVVSEVQNSSSATALTLAAGWGLDADATHLYKVKVWDNASTPSGYSSGTMVTPSSWSAVTITTPAAAAVLTSNLLSAAWTVAAADQAAVNLRLMKTFDQFGRTTASGWGTSNLGSVYTVSGGSAADFLTGNDGTGLFVGTITLATVNVARTAIADATSAASDVTMDIRCPVTPTGAAIVSSLVMFYVDANNHWRADVTFNTTGTVQLSIVKVVAGVTTTVLGPTQVYATHVTSRVYSVRMAYASGRIMAKLWDVNEPNYWNVSVAQTEPETFGKIGARAIANTGNTNGSQLMRYDNIRRNTLDKVYDSGWMNTTDLDWDVPYGLGDLTAWTLEVVVQNGERNVGRWPARHFTVDYTEPATPTLVVTAVPGVGALRVTITNPAPGGGQPALLWNDIYRKKNGEDDLQALRFATQVASSGVWDDNQAIGGVDYLYRVRAFGVNGTQIDSAWT